MSWMSVLEIIPHKKGSKSMKKIFNKDNAGKF